MPATSPTHSLSDGQLLAHYARSKDQHAFRQLVDRHLGWIYGTARRLTHDPALADDVAQGVFLALATKAPVLARHTSITAWLFQATRLGASTALRQRARQKARERMAVPPPDSVTPSDHLELADHLDAAVRKLSRLDRLAILAHFYEQAAIEETAARLHTTPAAARKRIDRALEKLRQRLAPPQSPDTFSAAIAAIAATHAPAHTTTAILAGTATPAAISIKAAVTATAGAAAKLVLALAAILVISLAGVFTICFTPTPPPHATPVAPTPSSSGSNTIELTPELAPFNRLALLAKARDRVAAIKDLTVDFHVDTIIANLDDPTWNAHYRVAVKGPDKIYIETEYSPRNAKKTLLRITAYNGSAQTFLSTEQSAALVRTSPDPQSLSTRDLFFFEANMIHDAVPWVAPPELGSLVALLNSPWTVVHPKIEKIAGHRCEAVDWTGGLAGQPEFTLWIDLDRGLLPLRHVSYTGLDHKPLILITTLDAVQVTGVWFATLSERHVYAVRPGISEVIKRTEVTGRTEGTLALKLNQSLPDSFFNLWEKMPEGSVVTDQRTNKTTVVGGGRPSMRPMDPINIPGLDAP